MTVRLHGLLALVVLGIGGASLNTMGCGGGGSAGGGGGSGGSSADPCFDYSKFDGKSPATTFAKDVLPIFRRSCGISSSCHGPDSTGGINLPPNQPYLGPALSGKDPTPAQIQMIIDGIVGRAAAVPGSPNPKPEADGYKIVEAGHPETSFLMWKIDAVLDENGESQFCSKLKCAPNMGCGVSMPQGGPELEAADKTTIRLWIAQGAKND